MSFDIRALLFEHARIQMHKCKGFLQTDSRLAEVRRRCRRSSLPASPRKPGCYIAGIAILFVALALFELRLVQASHAKARLGERIGGGPPVFS
jgi:hypothetical protein